MGSLRVVTTLFVVAALAIAGTLPGSAGADANSDYSSIRADFANDGKITPCAWTVAQLENARTVSASNPEDEYNGFPAAVEAELNRWRSGGCNPKPAPVAGPRFTVLLTVSPRVVRAGAFRTFTFRARVRSGGKTSAVPKVKVRFAGRIRTTNAKGTALLRHRFTAKQTRTATFTLNGRRLGGVVVRVLAAPKRRSVR